MYSARRPSPRAEYRLRRNEHVNNSPTVEQKFPALKKLSMRLDYFDDSGIARTGGINYTLNVAHAKSTLSFNCVHSDCVGGDFDLTQELSQAVCDSQKSISGEMRCQGIRHNMNQKDSNPCQGILRYKLTLGYKP